MDQQEQVTNRIFTLANIVSFIRLCMVPAYLVFLLEGHDILAAFMFALAASTDFVDGQLARRTHTVSRLGQLLDPAVDRILMIAGVVGLLLVGRLPLWIIVVVIARDLLLLCGAAFLLRYKKRIAVVFPGKVATTLLFVGFAGLLLNFPIINGLGLCDAAWLPGFNAEQVSWGIWFVYAGLALALATTAVYIYRGWRALQEALKERK
ncbi:MAG: CDP-alcohol phosphatidyltransferase family protein [Slackia sp.]|nr:CDP-alcohol phosphatidyltransferase family protein [Slackia sp.]